MVIVRLFGRTAKGTGAIFIKKRNERRDSKEAAPKDEGPDWEHA